MKLTKRNNALLLLACAALAGGCGATGAAKGGGKERPGTHDPLYEGKPLSQCVRDLADRHEPTQERAIFAIAGFGEEAVPSVLAALKEPDWLTRRNAVKALLRVSRLAGRPGLEALLGALKDRDARVRIEAARILREMVSTVAKWSETKEEERRPPFPDWDLLKEALPSLAEALNDSEAEVRGLSARALGSAGRPAAPWVPALAGRLEDENREVRLAAALGLAEVGTEEAKRAVPVSLLLEAMDDVRLNKFDRWSQREVVISAIGSLGPLAKPAIPKLVTLLHDDSVSSLRAAEALGDIGPEARDAIPALEKLAERGNYRKGATEALQKIRGE